MSDRTGTSSASDSLAGKRRQYYELEKQLARRIMDSRPEDRRRVAREVYADLYRQASWESQLEVGDADHEAGLQWNLDVLCPWIPGGARILDVGCGTGDLLRALAPRSKQCTGIDMTLAVIPQSAGAGDGEPRIEFLEMDLLQLDFPDASFDWVISVHVLEHLHPDDAGVHLREVQRVLRPGGSYLIETPNRITGPHDFSRGFDPVSTGLHLKEWSYGDLIAALKAHGFGRVECQMLPRRLFHGNERLFNLGRRLACWKVPLERACNLLPGLTLRSRIGKIAQIDMVVVRAVTSDK